MPSLFGETPIRMGSLSLSPPSAFVDLDGGGSPSFSANLSVGPGISSQVEWSVNGIVGGNTRLGTITPVPSLTTLAYYNPPTVLPTVPLVVRATSVALPSLFAEAPVTLGRMRLSPQAVTLGVGQSQHFTTEVTLLSNDQRVVWSVNGSVGGSNTYGFITSDGTYHAPTLPGSPYVTVEATSLTVPQLKRQASLTIVSGVQVSPASISLVLGQSTQFTALTNPIGQPVTWSASAGSINSNGFFTAPNAPVNGPILIRAAITAVPSIFGTAQVTIGSISVVINPTGATVQVGQTQQFTAMVLPPGSNQQVSWSVNGIPGGSSTVGTITGSGLYTAPATVPQSRPAPNSVVPGSGMVTVRATSVAVPSAFAQADVTIDPGPQSRPKGSEKEKPGSRHK